jgi:hypothetical protein
MVTADGAQLRDNWISLALGLAYEVYKAEKEKAPTTAPLPPQP